MELTNITQNFGLLDGETQKALKAHGGPYEVFRVTGWEPIASPIWHLTTAYRVKPPPPAPREWWICDNYVFDAEFAAGIYKAAYGEWSHRNLEIIHVREVTD